MNRKKQFLNAVKILGEADQALRELEALPSTNWNHPSAIKARVAAMGVTRERNEITVQA